MKYSLDEILEIVKRDGDFEYDLLEMGKIWGYRSLRFNFHRRFRYDFETGKLFYRYKPNGSKKNVGDEVGSITQDGYMKVFFNNEEYKLHRIINIMFNDDFDEFLQVDHINGIRNDNRLENLRMVTNQENQKNVKLRKDNITGEIGINFNKKRNKYRVECTQLGKKFYGGLHTTLEQAKKARDALHKKHGFHPNHGRHQRTL